MRVACELCGAEETEHVRWYDEPHWVCAACRELFCGRPSWAELQAGVARLQHEAVWRFTARFGTAVPIRYRRTRVTVEALRFSDGKWAVRQAVRGADGRLDLLDDHTFQEAYEPLPDEEGA